MIARARNAAWVVIACATWGCGGAQPETPETPKAEPASEAPSAPDEKPDTDEPAASKDKGEKPASTESEPPARPSRSPKDILTAEGSLFSLSFAESDIHAEADKECSDKAGDDPKKKADCMAKARDKVDHDSLIFKQEADGKWVWITLRRAGAKVTVLHKVEFEFGDETEKTITILPKGRDQGTKPKAFPAKVVIETSDTGITLSDPKLGKLVYISKLGQVGDPGR